MYTSFQNDKFCYSFVFMIIGPECIIFSYDCYSVVHHWHLHLIFLSFHLLFVLHKQQLNFLVTEKNQCKYRESELLVQQVTLCMASSGL